jgi:hypothetical protein
MKKTVGPINKEGWGPGPWQDEQDAYAWKDASTGLDCRITRTPGVGILCGYVRIPYGHALYNRKNIPRVFEDLFNVHGGITYSEMEKNIIWKWWKIIVSRHELWVGFDTAHSDDYMPAMKNIRNNSWWASHGTYKDEMFVMTECANLARQIKEANNDR